MLASLSGKGPMVRYPAMVRTAKPTPARGTSRASRLLPRMVVPPLGLLTHPTLVGAGVPILAALDHDLWDAQSVGYPLANFCALYALAVWTPPRRFAGGFALVMAVWLGFSLRGGEFPND